MSFHSSRLHRGRRPGNDAHSLSIVFPVANTTILVGGYVGSSDVRLRDDIHHCPTRFI